MALLNAATGTNRDTPGHVPFCPMSRYRDKSGHNPLGVSRYVPLALAGTP